LPYKNKQGNLVQKKEKRRAIATHTDLENGTTEGKKTRIKHLANVVQGKKKLHHPLLIAGFPEAGLVGAISTSYIINKLHMNQFACVESEFIVPGVIYSEGKLRHPFRLYSNEKGDVCVLVCEAPIMIQGMHSVLDAVMSWALQNQVKQVMVLDGIPVEGLPDPNRTPIILSSESGEADAASLLHSSSLESTNSNKEPLKDNSRSIYPTTAFVGGMSGGILSSCLSNGIASKALLIYSSRGIPDPDGAAILIESLARITDNESLKIDTRELKEQGAILKTRLEKIIQSYTEQRGEGTVESPKAVKEGVMYG